MEKSKWFSKIACCFLLAGCTLFLCSPSGAQDTYPSKPVILNVAYGAGGSTDFEARAYAASLEKMWRQPVVVVNKPGAAGAIMLAALKNTPPDGYNLGVFATGAITGPHLKEVPYNFFDDFTHLAQLIDYDMGLVVNAESAWKTAKDLVEYGQKNPGKLRYGSSGVGTSSHLLSEQFGFMNKVKMVNVPFAGDAEATTALLGNHIDIIVQPLTSCGPQIKAGQLRLLLVFYDKRAKDFPDVPTARETGYQPFFYKLGVHGVCGPRNLPPAVIEKIVSGIKASSQNPELIALLEKQYLRATFRAGEEWITFLKKGDEEEAASMKKLGLKLVK